MSPRDWRHRIQDVLEAAARIHTYTENMDASGLRNDRRTLDAVIRNFIIIGEAASKVPEAVKQAHPQVPWRLMADMRNFAVHEYWGVAPETIWRTIEADLPSLVPMLDAILGRE